MEYQLNNHIQALATYLIAVELAPKLHKIRKRCKIFLRQPSTESVYRPGETSGNVGHHKGRLVAPAFAGKKHGK